MLCPACVGVRTTRSGSKAASVSPARQAWHRECAVQLTSGSASQTVQARTALCGAYLGAAESKAGPGKPCSPAKLGLYRKEQPGYHTQWEVGRKWADVLVPVLTKAPVAGIFSKQRLSPTSCLRACCVHASSSFLLAAVSRSWVPSITGCSCTGGSCSGGHRSGVHAAAVLCCAAPCCAAEEGCLPGQADIGSGMPDVSCRATA